MSDSHRDWYIKREQINQAEAMTLGDRICVMYEGKIQQVAPPMEIYDKPINKFVAGFLGTPPMNFFDGKIVVQGSEVCFVLSDGTGIALSKFTNTLIPYANKEIVLGVRPEHLDVSKSAQGIEAKVDVVEPLGDRKEVYLTSSSGENFIVNLNPHIDIKMNDTVTMRIDINKVHVFEPGNTGKNITI